jgi:hypothetical protein
MVFLPEMAAEVSRKYDKGFPREFQSEGRWGATGPRTGLMYAAKNDGSAHHDFVSAA